jgi:hypothetical protein
MFNSVPQRFLVYQASHGFGVELFLLETAFEIARTLNRTLVLPPMPELETTNYRDSLDEYFRLETDWPWISAQQFFEQHGKAIDLVFQVVPRYRKEYSSSEIRRLHPVWLDSIEGLTGFAKMQFQTDEVIRLQIERPMTLSEVRGSFSSDYKVIGISYLNGLLEDVSGLVEAVSLKNSAYLLRHVPVTLQDRFLTLAHGFAGEEPYTAIHWRRGHHMREVVKILENQDLPTAEAMMGLAGETATQIVVATDSGLEDFKHFSGRKIRSFRHNDPQVNALVDMALCIGADRFVGTWASAFTAYVGYARRAGGHLPETTVCL